MVVNKTDSWRMAFWVITTGSVLLFGACFTGYFKLETKIASAQESIRSEKAQDIEKIENKIVSSSAKIDRKIEKLDHKIENIQIEQKTMSQQSSKQYLSIMIAIEKLKNHSTND